MDLGDQNHVIVAMDADVHQQVEAIIKTTFLSL